MGLFPIALGLVVLAIFLLPSLSHNSRPDLVESISTAVLFLIGILLSAQMSGVSLRFTATTVEQHSLFGKKILPLDGLRGRRQVVRDTGEGKMRSLQIVPQNSQLKPIEFTRSYGLDEAFHIWFQSLPDLGQLK